MRFFINKKIFIDITKKMKLNLRSKTSPANIIQRATYDKFLQIEDCIERLRREYESCKGVISEQICTFIASVALFMSAKYLEKQLLNNQSFSSGIHKQQNDETRGEQSY